MGLKLGLQGTGLGLTKAEQILRFVSFSQASKAWRKNKMDESKHEIHSQVDAITAGTASVVNLTAGRLDSGSLCVVGEQVQAECDWLRSDCTLTHGRECVCIRLSQEVCVTNCR